ncbi:conserved protein of unknown function [Methanocaldococcus lauensis]|nr:conserved protein of unknown function [Methanocaldococcus lauensis]
MPSGFDSPPAPLLFCEIMEKIYSKFGNIKDLKEIISGLTNFTGIIRIDNAFLYYINSKLISSKLDGKEEDLEEIFQIIPDTFLIEIYEGSEEEVKYALRNFKPEESIVEISKLSLVFGDNVILNSYNDIYKFLMSGCNKVTFIPKRFKDEKAVVIYKNSKEIFAIYFGKKTLFGKKAISKLKTTFAVSEIIAKIEILSNKDLNIFKNKYAEGFIFGGESFTDIIKKIMSSKEPIILKNASLLDALSYGTSLIKIEGSKEGYIISKNGKPIYAFLENYNGERSYRLIKSMCMVEDVKFHIYSLSKEEYDLFKGFKENKVPVQ